MHTYDYLHFKWAEANTMRFPIELSQFVRLFMAVEKVYFLELLYSIAIDICYQFLQQMAAVKKKKASW